MTIIKYNSAVNVELQFEDGFIKTCSYRHFKQGSVYNPFDKSNYNVGYCGIGKYTSTERFYSVWRSMLKRCYDEKYSINSPTYIGCTVAKEWHNYQVFAKWYDDNYYEINGEVVDLDKDILHKGNKIYSPETCVFVPHRINSLFVRNNARRGKLPIGVSKELKRFKTQCQSIDKKSIYLGRYDTIEQAFAVYKKYKEKYIKQIADTYYGLIPQKLYDAMYTYTVEMTD